mgnify:CR=1 FL=1
MVEIKAKEQVLIYYFSGSGNAKQVAFWFAELAKQKEFEAQTIDIAKTDVLSIKEIPSDALILFISPIHGFNYPEITLRFIENFPKGKNRVVLMNTRAGLKCGRFVTPGLTGVAFLISSIFLKIKGYKIFGAVPFDMPSNWITLHPVLKKESKEFLFQVNYERVKKHAEKIFSGKRDLWACRDIVQDLLISPISFAYFLLGRFILSKSFYANDQCNLCGLCIKECPTQAIKMVNNRPYWTLKCQNCMMCVYRCPRKAIEAAHGLFLITSIVYSVLMSLLFNSFIKIKSPFMDWMVTSILFLTLLLSFYKVQHLLLKNKTIAKIISKTSLTHYKFWQK